ncbi:hypothetical protein LMH73_024880 [Vibrio splendidus]|nr:hypothetical protein [Vibrio splendidus]MCC4881465.1 hypothetical protein [Vibrio splendidus]
MKTDNQKLSEIMQESVYDTLTHICDKTYLVNAISSEMLVDAIGVSLEDVISTVSKYDRDELSGMAYDLIMTNSANAEILQSYGTIFYIDAAREYSINTDDYRKFDLLDRLMVVDMFVTGNGPLEVRDHYDSLSQIDIQEIVSKMDNSFLLSDDDTSMILSGLKGEFLFVNDGKELELEEKVKEQAVFFHKMIKDCVLKGKMIKKMLDSNASMKVTL